MENLNFTATFERELNSDLCPDTEIEALEAQISDVEGYQENTDYSIDGENIKMSFSFAIDVDLASSPSGSHPYDCQSDCGYCDAMDSYQEYYEGEVEKAQSDLESELKDVDGFDELACDE